MATRDYERDGLIVHWDAQLCQHSAVCWHSLPEVFRPKDRPWIAIEGAALDLIKDTVRACPSGALRYTETSESEEPVATGAGPQVTVHPEPNGPLVVQGPVGLIDAEGTVVRSGEKFLLCRCGQSNSKPFCDGSHRRTGFRTD